MSEPPATYDVGPRRAKRAGRRAVARPAPKQARGRAGPADGSVLLCGEVAGFPGCKGVPMTADEMMESEDGPHIEYWDAEDGIAWMVREDAGFDHELPANRLPVLLHGIAQARGADVVCGGHMTFYERGADGKHIRAMEADQTVFLDHAAAYAMTHPPIVLGSLKPPDVVLEVDHTTDVRRRKLGEYERWRFPEVWVEVPEAESQSRAKSRKSGLTIHRLDAKTGCYAEVHASGKLLGWTAEEIHLALNERRRSKRTSAALVRVGRAMGEAGGTAPADDPILRHILDEATAAAKSVATLDAVRQILDQRGIGYAPGLFEGLPAQHDREALVAVALACHSEADFLARLAVPPGR